MKKIDLIINDKTYKDVYVAESFLERFKGLMFVPKEKSFNLLIKKCNSIHTCFMKFNIDIFCLDKDFKVIKVYKGLKPFRFVLPVKNTYNILEIPTKQRFR